MKKKFTVLIALIALVATFSFFGVRVHAEGEDITTEPETTLTTEITTTEEITTADSELSQEDIEAIAAEIADNIGISDWITEFWDFMPAWIKIVFGIFGIGTPISLIAYVVQKAKTMRKTFGSSKQLDADINNVFDKLNSFMTAVATIAKAQGDQGTQIASFTLKTDYVAKALNLLIQTSTKEDIIARKDSLIADYTAAFNSTPETIDTVSASQELVEMATNLLKQIKG